jgi:succinoglycan biosynthesis protein ExoV
MKLYYWRGGNFGDDINPWLWPKLGLQFKDDSLVHFVGIGTLLNDWIVKGPKIIFGSGVGYGNLPDLSNSEILAVRGPLSAKEVGCDLSKAITDPGCLVSEFIQRRHAQGSVCFMPHHKQAKMMPLRQVCELAHLEYLDPRDNFEVTLSRLAQSSLVLAGAMHAAIVADALGIPWIPVVIDRGTPVFKWQDWCASLDLPYNPIELPPVWPYTGESRLLKLRNWLRIQWVSNHFRAVVNKRKSACLSSRGLLNEKKAKLRELIERLPKVEADMLQRHGVPAKS